MYMKLDRQSVLVRMSHTLGLFFSQDGSDRFVSIGFGLGKKLDLLANQKRVDIVYSIDENEWNGSVSLQLRIRDIRPSSMG